MKITKTRRLLGTGLALSLMSSLALAGCEPAPDYDDTETQVVERTRVEDRALDRAVDRQEDAVTDTPVTRKDSTAELTKTDNRGTQTEDSKSSAVRRSDIAGNDAAAPNDESVDSTVERDETVATEKDVAPVKRSGEGNADIVALTKMETELSTFHQLLSVAGLEDMLGEGRYTVLAPNNQAFAKLPKAQLDGLRQNRQKLRQVLMYHFIKQPVSSDQLSKQKSALTMFEGRKLNVTPGTPATSGKPVIQMPGQPATQSARLTRPDIWTSNGTVHIIDKVLIPADLQS